MDGYQESRRKKEIGNPFSRSSFQSPVDSGGRPVWVQWGCSLTVRDPLNFFFYLFVNTNTRPLPFPCILAPSIVHSRNCKDETAKFTVTDWQQLIFSFFPLQQIEVWMWQSVSTVLLREPKGIIAHIISLPSRTPEVICRHYGNLLSDYWEEKSGGMGGRDGGEEGGKERGRKKCLSGTVIDKMWGRQTARTHRD